MNKIIRFVAVFVFAIVVSAVSASAQTTTKVDVTIPFDFTVGKANYSAGTYEVTVLTTGAGMAHVYFSENDGDRITGVTARPERQAAEATPQLVFDVEGSTKTLSLVETYNGRYSVVQPARKRSVVIRTSIPMTSTVGN